MPGESKMKTAYVDEVGTGSIAGPALVCAVAIGDNHPKIKGVNDSKKLTKKKREELYPIIAEQVKFAFGAASPNRIKTMNIHYGKYIAMKEAVERLVRSGEDIREVIVDGNFVIPNLNIPQKAVIKADEIYWQVGAASILAKVKRDKLMADLAKIERFSYYDFENNAGYYAPKHRDGVIFHGPTPFHRVNFGYFKYCMTLRNEYLKFVKWGGGEEEYLNWEFHMEKHYGISMYKIWKQGVLDPWQEIKYGEKNG